MEDGMRKNSTALVTGASSGFGLKFAEILAGQGYDLVLTARNEGKLNALKHELESRYQIRAYVCPADLSAKDAALDIFRYTAEHDLKIDVLINNAGFGDSGNFADSGWQKQYDMVQVNIAGMMQLTHCFLKPMIERGYGRIMNVSSVAAFCAGPHMSVYYASKAFVLSFSEAVAEEVKGTGVAVTAFCPGPTATGFEQAASMKKGSVMFRHAAKAEDAAEDGIRAMLKGKTVRYQGMFTKSASLMSRMMPRMISRKFAGKMNG